MPELSLGISPCPNDVFIFSGLLLGAVQADGYTFRVDYQDVETTNQRSQRGEYDVVKISYANLPLVSDRYNLLPSGGALGRGVGPLLLSHDGGWDPEAEVLVPGQYTTANFLLDFWAKRPLAKRFISFDALYAELCDRPGAQGVVIHEKRFTYAQDGLTLLQDLGTHWEQETGYPIPLGAIIARKDLPIEPINRAVRDSLRWAYAHDDEAFDLCRQHAQDLTPSVIRSHIDLYVNEYSDDLGPDGEAAVAFFLEQQRTAAAWRK
jgi:1,4-dihydroxy-6-naphthoate synthase